jgi:hypothetical protein
MSGLSKLEQAKAKAAAGMALNISELCLVTGYGRRKIMRDVKDGLPLHNGQIRLTSYWDWVENQHPFVKTSTPSTPEPSSDRLSIVDKLREPRGQSDLQAA